MLANFPQSVAKEPIPIALLVGFGLLLTIATGTWVKSRKREQRLASRRDEYRKSDDWQRKRALVLKRDKYRCVYCGARARRVHQRRYAPQNIGSEPIEWLVSGCEACYDKLNPDFGLHIVSYLGCNAKGAKRDCGCNVYITNRVELLPQLQELA